jgi:hypothetical protein
VDLTAGAGVKVAGSPALEHAVAFASTRERMAGTDAGNSGDGWMGARLPDTAGREARKREKNYLHPAAEKRHCSLFVTRVQSTHLKATELPGPLTSARLKETVYSYGSFSRLCRTERHNHGIETRGLGQKKKQQRSAAAAIVASPALLRSHPHLLRQDKGNVFSVQK